VAKAGGAGLGVFALETIPAGSFLWMYEGKRMRTGDRDESQAARFIARQGGDIRYCVGCEGGVTIDASQGGNDSRFVNHFEGAWVCVCVCLRSSVVSVRVCICYIWCCVILISYLPTVVCYLVRFCSGTVGDNAGPVWVRL
jgi:hypothetical protein